MSAQRTLLVGVGGQGVLTAAQVLGAAAHASGAPVVVGQLHGMSQRGGSIECTVVVAGGESTFIGPGEADVVLAFEPLEALRALPRMRADTHLLVSLDAIVPVELTLSGRRYPDVAQTLATLCAYVREVVPVDAGRIVGQSGADRTLNAVVLGAASELGWTAAGASALLAELIARSAASFRAANRQAFEAGRAAARNHRTKADARS